MQERIRKRAQKAIFNTKRKKAFVKILNKNTNNEKTLKKGTIDDNDNMSYQSSNSRFQAPPLSINISYLKNQNSEKKFQSERGSILTGSDSLDSDPRSLQLLQDGPITSGREIKTPLSRFASKKQIQPDHRDSIFTLEMEHSDPENRVRKGSLKTTQDAGFLSPFKKTKRSRKGISRFAIQNKQKNGQRRRGLDRSKDESSWNSGEGGDNKSMVSGFESINSSFQDVK